MNWSWITTSMGTAIMVIISTVGIYVALILFTRIAGLRSFSKMSGFDFAVTVAIGSVIASTIITKDPPLIQAIVALGALYCIQMFVAHYRGSSSFMSKLVDNKPLLLMKGGTMLEENMKKAKVSHSDMLAKLREANVIRFEQVLAVVMESTGDVSVLHYDGDDELEIEPKLLEDLRDNGDIEI